MDYSHNFITTRLRVLQIVNNLGFSIQEVHYTNGEIKLRSWFFGWFLRLPAQIVQFIVNRNIVNVIEEYLNQGQTIWRIKKSVHEGIFMIIRKC